MSVKTGERASIEERLSRNALGDGFSVGDRISFARYGIPPQSQRFANRNDDSPGASPDHHIRRDVADDADGTVAEFTDSKRQFEDKCLSSARKQMSFEWSSEGLSVSVSVVIVLAHQRHE